MLLVDIMIRYFAFGFQCFGVYKLLWVWVIVVLLICHLGVRLGWGKRWICSSWTHEMAAYPKLDPVKRFSSPIHMPTPYFPPINIYF
jgi:hypothetical protein